MFCDVPFIFTQVGERAQCDLPIGASIPIACVRIMEWEVHASGIQSGARLTALPFQAKPSMHREGGTMKTTSFATAALIAVVLAVAAISGPASAQFRGPNRNFQGNARVFAPQVRVFAPQMNVFPGQVGSVPSFVPPSTFSSFASPNRGFSSNVSPFGTSFSGYAAQSFPRVLTPFGPMPTTYSTFSTNSSYGSGFGYPGYLAPSTTSSFASPNSGLTSYTTPYGTLYSGYAAQSFPRVLTPFGGVPLNYNTYFGTSSPYGSAFGSGFTNPYGLAP
jgi:hypothetical protein